MIFKYFATLVAAICLITLGASTLPFAVDSCVLSGQAVNEHLQIEFTLDADSDHTYKINDEMAQSLQNDIRFTADGSARVLTTHIEITPKSISWKEGNNNITAPGALMTAQVKWDTPSDVANGTPGTIYLDFPPSFQGVTPTFHSGQYQLTGVSGSKRYVIRELTAYQSTFQLYMARFGYGLIAGLPFGILLHAICWAFVVKREKKERIENFPPQGRGFPHTFYANPVAEWTAALIVICIGDFVACVLSGIAVFDNFVSSDMVPFIYGILAVGAVATAITVFFASRSVLTVHVDSNSLSYLRGRKNQQWVSTAWSEILTIVEKTRRYRGTTYYWIEVEFKEARKKKLKIPTSLIGYPDLRDLLFGQNKS